MNWKFAIEAVAYTAFLLLAGRLWEQWRKHRRRKRAIRKLVARVMEYRYDRAQQEMQLHGRAGRRSDTERKPSVVEEMDVL